MSAAAPARSTRGSARTVLREKSGLKQRILTALVLVPLVVCGVLFLETAQLSLVFALIVLGGSLEWAKLAGISSRGMKLAYAVAVAVGLWSSAILLRQHQGALWLLVVAAGWWIAVVVRLLRHRPGGELDQGVSMTELLEGFVTLIPAWAALAWLHGRHGDGPEMTLFLLILIWVADSGAYFAGRRWGKVKLAPRISPGKTREGVYGALAGAALCALAMSVVQGYGGFHSLMFVFLCILTTVFSVVGDLFESLVKRRRGLKDSGAILPGHGGILDRIDSLTAAAPIFALGLGALGLLG